MYLVLQKGGRSALGISMALQCGKVVLIQVPAGEESLPASTASDRIDSKHGPRMGIMPGQGLGICSRKVGFSGTWGKVDEARSDWVLLFMENRRRSTSVFVGVERQGEGFSKGRRTISLAHTFA